MEETALREFIIEKYGTLSAFGTAADIPYTTMASILKRGRVVCAEINKTPSNWGLFVISSFQIDVYSCDKLSAVTYRGNLPYSFTSGNPAKLVSKDRTPARADADTI